MAGEGRCARSLSKISSGSGRRPNFEFIFRVFDSADRGWTRPRIYPRGRADDDTDDSHISLMDRLNKLNYISAVGRCSFDVAQKYVRLLVILPITVLNDRELQQIASRAVDTSTTTCISQHYRLFINVLSRLWRAFLRHSIRSR